MSEEGETAVALLAEYLRRLPNLATHDEWWRRFHQVLRALSSPSARQAPAEKRVLDGREFALMGNLAFCYDADPHAEGSRSSQPMTRLLAQLKRDGGGDEPLGVSTNGWAFHVYRLADDEPGPPRLRVVDGLNLRSPMATAERCVEVLSSWL